MIVPSNDVRSKSDGTPGTATAPVDCQPFGGWQPSAAAAGATRNQRIGTLSGEQAAPPATMTTEQVASDDRVRRLIIREVERETADLAAFEQIRRVAILPRDLTVEDEELSPTLKIRRRVVAERYAPLLVQAYAEDLHARKASLGV